MGKFERYFSFKKAFSLVELAIVTLVIGVILVAALKGQDLVTKSRISKAIQLTGDSPVTHLPNVEMWFEVTNSLSFKEDEHQNYTDLTSSEQSLGIGSITKWYDRNPHPVKRKNATAASISQAPKYYRKCINGTPCLKFDGTQNYLTIENTNGLTLGDYSIFIVEKKESSSAIALIGSSSSLTDDASLEIGYKDDTTIYWHQGTSSSAQREYAVTELSNQTQKLHTFINRTNMESDTTAVEYYLNTNLVATSNSGTSTDFTTSTLGSSLEIGRSGGSSYYQGGISEIIIIPFAVSASQRTAIEKYLRTKWNVSDNPVNPIIIIEIPEF